MDQVILLIFPKMRKLRHHRLNLGGGHRHSHSHNRMLLLLTFFLVGASSSFFVSAIQSSSPPLLQLQSDSDDDPTAVAASSLSSAVSAGFGARESSLKSSTSSSSSEDHLNGPPVETVTVTYVADDGVNPNIIPTSGLTLSQASAEEAVAAVEALEANGSVEQLPHDQVVVDDDGVDGDDTTGVVAAAEGKDVDVEGAKDEKERGRSGRRLNFNHFHPHPPRRNNPRSPPPPPPHHHRFQVPQNQHSHHPHPHGLHHVRPQRESLRVRGQPQRPRPSILIDNNNNNNNEQQADGIINRNPNPDLQSDAQTLYDLRGFHTALGQQLRSGQQPANIFPLVQQQQQQVAAAQQLHHQQQLPRLNNPFASPLQLQSHQDLRNSPLIFPSFFQPQVQQQQEHENNNIQNNVALPSSSSLPQQTHNLITTGVGRDTNIFGHNQHHQQSVFELPSHLHLHQSQRGGDRDKEQTEFRPSQIDPSLTNLPLAIQQVAASPASSTATSTTENSFSFTPVHQPFLNLQRQPSQRQVDQQEQQQQQQQQDGGAVEVGGKQPESFIYVYEDIDYDGGAQQAQQQQVAAESEKRRPKQSQELKSNNNGGGSASSSSGINQIRTNQPTAILIDTTTVPPLVSSLAEQSRFHEQVPNRQNLIEVDAANDDDERHVLGQFSPASFSSGPNVEIVPSSERKPPPDQSNAISPALTITQRPSGRFIGGGDREREREEFRLGGRRPPPPPNGPFDIFAPPSSQQQQLFGPPQRPGFDKPPRQRQPPLPFLDQGESYPRGQPPPQRRPSHQFQVPSGPENSNESQEDFFNGDVILNQKLNPFLRPNNNNNNPFNNPHHLLRRPPPPQNPSNINFNPPPHNQLYDSQSPFLQQQQHQQQQIEQEEQEQVLENEKNVDDFNFQSQKFAEPDAELVIPTRLQQQPIRSTTTTTTPRTTTPAKILPFNAASEVDEDEQTKSNRPSSSFPVRSRFPPFPGSQDSRTTTVRGTTSAPATTTTESTTEAPRVRRPNRPSRVRPARPNKVPSTTPIPEVSQDIDYDYDVAKPQQTRVSPPTVQTERPRIRTRPAIRVTTTAGPVLTHHLTHHPGGRFHLEPSAPSSLPVRGGTNGEGPIRQVFERPTGRGPPPSRFEVEAGFRDQNREYDRYNNDRPQSRPPPPPPPPSAPPRSIGKPLYLSGKMLEKEGGLYAGLRHIASDHVYGSPIPLIPINQVFDRMPDIYNGKVVSPSGPPRPHHTHILPPFPPLLHSSPPPHFIRNNNNNNQDFSDFHQQQQQQDVVNVNSGKTKIKVNSNKITRPKSVVIHATTPDPKESFRQTTVQDKFVRKPNPKIRQHHTQTALQSDQNHQQPEVYINNEEEQLPPPPATANGPRGRVVGNRRKRPTTTTESPVTTTRHVSTTTESVLVTVSEEVSAPFHFVTRTPPVVVQAEETPTSQVVAGTPEKFTPFRRRPNRPVFKKPKPTIPTSNQAEEPPIPPPRPQPPRKLRARPRNRFVRPNSQKVPEPTDDNEQQPEEDKEVQVRDIPLLTSSVTTTTEPPASTGADRQTENTKSVRIFRKPTEAPGRFSSRFREENPPFAVTRTPIQLTTKRRPSFKPAKTTKTRLTTTTTSTPTSPRRKPASVPQAEDNIPPSIRLKAEDVIARRKPARRIPADSVSLRLQEKRRKLQGARRKVTPTDFDPEGDFTSAESRSDTSSNTENAQNKREITHHHTVLETGHNQLLDEDLKDEGNTNNSTEVDSEETAAVLKIPKPTNGTNLESSITSRVSAVEAKPEDAADIVKSIFSKGKYDDSDEEDGGDDSDDVEIIALNNDRRVLVSTTPSPNPDSAKSKLQLAMQRKRERGTTTTTTSSPKFTGGSRGVITSSSIRDRDIARIRTSKRPKVKVQESQEASGSESVYTSATLSGIPFSLKSPSTTASPFSIFTMATQEPSLPLEAHFPIFSHPSLSSSSSSSTSSSEITTTN